MALLFIILVVSGFATRFLVSLPTGIPAYVPWALWLGGSIVWAIGRAGI